MSDEDEKLLDDYVQKLGPKFPIVRAPKGMSTYGGQFYPSTFTVGPDGEILTAPNDRMPSDSFLEENLANVSLAPNLPADSRYDAVRQGWEKKEYKRLSEYLEKMLAQDKLGDEMRGVLEAQRDELQQRSEKQLARVEKLGEGPDYGDAEAKLERIAKEWKGLAPAEAAQKQLDRFGKDATIKKEITAGRALTKLSSSYDTSRKSQKGKLIEELEKFGKRFAGTHAAKKAAELRTQLVTSGD